MALRVEDKLSVGKELKGRRGFKLLDGTICSVEMPEGVNHLKSITGLSKSANHIVVTVTKRWMPIYGMQGEERQKDEDLS